MGILDLLLNNLNVDAPIRSILVGAHWTVVSSRNCGMAATQKNTHPHAHSQVRDAGHFLGKSARELAEYSRSDNLLEASIGLAAINSLLDVDESQATQINAVEVLREEGRNKLVALIGHFPFIQKLQPAVGQLWVIEQQPAPGEYPAGSADKLLPLADIVAITSSTLINHTLDALLTLCRPDAQVMLLGPSTPLFPLLFDCGVTFLSGSRVIDEPAVFRTAGQGASFQQVEGVTRLTFRRNLWNSQ